MIVTRDHVFTIFWDFRSEFCRIIRKFFPPLHAYRGVIISYPLFTLIIVILFNLIPWQAPFKYEWLWALSFVWSSVLWIETLDVSTSKIKHEYSKSMLYYQLPTTNYNQFHREVNEKRSYTLFAVIYMRYI